jgi:hypothetical protein
MANPMPTEAPVGEKIALLIPIAAPRVSIRGPPEFPGLMGASIWMKSS